MLAERNLRLLISISIEARKYQIFIWISRSVLGVFLQELGPNPDNRLPSCLWALVSTDTLEMGFSFPLLDLPAHLRVRWNKIGHGPWHVAM